MFNYLDYKDLKTGYTSISVGGDGAYNPDLDISRYTSSDSGELADYPRPLSITLIVWYHIIGLLIGVGLFIFVVKALPSYTPWVWLLTIVGNIILAFSLVELWKMKKAGAVAFVIQIIFGYLIDLLTKSEPSYLGLTITLIMTAFIFLHYKEMQ